MESLALDRVMRSAEAALKERGLGWSAQAESEAIRVWGPPGRFDPYLVTEVWAGPGLLRAECSIPVLVPQDRLVRILELCALLSGQGRVGFALGRRGTPLASVTVLFPAEVDEVAPRMCAAAFGFLWDYASSAEPLFAAVAAGSELEQVVGDAMRGGPAGPAAFPIAPRPPESPQGTCWEGALETVPQPPDDFPVPEPQGYTDEERRGLLAAFSRCQTGEGLINACGGPLLIHADGAVECFGCTAPGVHPHLANCTVSCAPGLYLGNGHLCERCEAQA